MKYKVYLSGEIHTDWREEIMQQTKVLNLEIEFHSPVTNHKKSDDCGVEIMGQESNKFWHDHKGAKLNAIRTKKGIDDADIVVIRFGDKYKQWNAAFDAGYAAAFRAQDLGVETLLVERYENLGGVCLNVGCIPSKALLQSSHHYEVAAKEFESHGIEFTGLNLNLESMLARKDQAVDDLTKGIEWGETLFNFLLKEGLDKNNKVTKVLIYPKKSKAMNLAFDVTPAKYVTGLITEKGVCEASQKGLKSLFK